MAKVIEFYLRGPIPKKVKPVPIEQRGKVVEFPEAQVAAQSKTEDITERGEVSPPTILFFVEPMSRKGCETWAPLV